MSKLIQPSEIENLIYRSAIVQNLLDQVKGESEDYDINIGVPIAKSFEENGKLIIAGYASVEVIDSQDEFIPLETLKASWDQFSSNKDFMIGTLMHSNIPVIHILKEYKDSKGQMWKSGVDDTGLFIVAEVNDATEKGKQTKQLIQEGKLTGFSIGGEALASTLVNEGKTYTRIDKMELHEIAVVDRPANKPSVFTIVKREAPEDSITLTKSFFDKVKAEIGEEALEKLMKMSWEECISQAQERGASDPEALCGWLRWHGPNAQKQDGKPKTDEERAMQHFNITSEKWNTLSNEEKQGYIDKLPERGSVFKFDKLDKSLGKLNKYNITKPYPNEHACRIKQPSEFQEDSYARIKQGNLSIIIAKPKGKDTTTTQAYRYPKDKYTVEQARSHCEKEGGSFTAASSEKGCGTKKPKLKINKKSLSKMDKAISKLSHNVKLKAFKKVNK